jgi:hypothetical protein
MQQASITGADVDYIIRLLRDRKVVLNQLEMSAQKLRGQARRDKLESLRLECDYADAIICRLSKKD